MAERPLPEAIRGSWYYLPASVNPKTFNDKPPQVLRFRLDGSFTRYFIKDTSWEEKEAGDYTFDGQFLIIRGRNTDTFRVRPEGYWKWNLEGKKEDRKLLRGRVVEEDFVDLAADDAKEIRILPIRVTVRSDVAGSDVIYELVYRNDDREQVVGSFFVEHDADTQKMWVGLAPYVTGIEAKTWERIVRESFLDIYLSKPDDVRVVTVRLLNSNESRVFNYELA